VSKEDFNLYNMPDMFARDVRRQDPMDASKWIRDEEWYSTTREQFYNLFLYLQERQLVVRRLVESRDDVDRVVLKFSELTDRGQAFVKSRADERWLASFDRPGTKKVPSDWTYLDKQLRKVRVEK
jgi:hypothetical protein